MLKHERYCGKWNRRWVLRWPNEHKCDGFQVTGEHLLFCSHQAHSGKGNPPLCTSVGGRQPIPCILVIALWSGRAVVSEPLPGCRKAEGTQRSSPELEELAFGTALCPSPWKTWMQENCKVRGWVNPARMESCALVGSGPAKAAAWAEGRLCFVQQWPFLAGSSSEGTALPA